MAAENISQEVRLKKNIDETRNYFKKHKKVCVTLSYIEHFHILAYTITGCISISDFSFLSVLL